MNKHGGYYGKEKNIIDFSVNINPLGSPQELKNNLIKNINTIEKYPEIIGDSYINKISNRFNIPAENIILGNGAIELIYLFVRSLQPRKSLIIQPTFNEYERALNLYGVDVYNHILDINNNFELKTEKLEEDIKQIKPEVIFFCNPNNPTGKYIEPKELEKLIKKSNDCIWFIDESFLDFTGKKGFENFIFDNNVILLRSLTKFYAIPGLRIGYAAGNKKIISKMYNYKEPWTINTYALIALDNILSLKGYEKETINLINDERKKLYNAFNDSSFLKIYKSYTNFHIFQLNNISAHELLEALLDKGIYIRTCEDFKALNSNCFRSSIRLKDENDYFIKSLYEILG